MISIMDTNVQIFLKGNETVHIPFKIQCFNADGATPELVSDDTPWNRSNLPCQCLLLCVYPGGKEPPGVAMPLMILALLFVG